MSQVAPLDAEPSADTTHPLEQQPPSEDVVTSDPATPSAPLQPPLIPESSSPPQSNEETTTEDEPTTATTATDDASQGPTDQSECAADGQVIECDQPVSLEPDTETAGGKAEVCCNFAMC